jgi:rubrerythrin
MSTDRKSIGQMLNLALATSLNHLDFYLTAANEAQDPMIKALLMVLGESEEELAGEIERMMMSGIGTAVQEVAGYDQGEAPDETPFDLYRAETDQRLFICNTALDMEVKGYTFYLSVAARAKSEVISRLFEYFAHMKARQITRIRRMCETF